MKKINLRRGQIATTLTWVAGFLIIFFIMLLFVSASALLAGKKFIPVIGEGRNVIEIERGLGSLENQRRLVGLLNTPTNNKKTLGQLIIEWELTKLTKNDLEKEIINILEKQEGCYLFRINYDLNNPSQDYIWVNKGDDFEQDYVEFVWGDFSTKIYELNLFSGDKKIKVGLYIGECS